MKIIHCADVHLGSRMRANLDESKAKIRRNEVLNTFLKMIDYAAENNVRAILIAGDLFDTARITVSVRKSVESAIRSQSTIDFYLLRGNHDASGFLDALEKVPENLHLFGDEWTRYILNPESGGNVVLYGAELSERNSASIYSSLVPDYDCFNIVLLHGQQNEYVSKNRAENISLGQLRGKGIDYLALGHVHEYHSEALDKRGTWVYSGCLEGRGYDECGEHGFVLLDVDEQARTFISRFVPFASRTIHLTEVDVTGCRDTAEMADRIRGELLDGRFANRDMVKAVLTGRLPISCDKNMDFLEQNLSELFFDLKLEDKTGYLVDYDAFALDKSLKGEFVRLLQAAPDLDDETRMRVIRLGIEMLQGK